MAILPQTQPFLDALDVNYDIPCLGTALFALQSNCNHDCDPNCHPFKDETDISGSCVLVARKPIQKGDELTISYLETTSWIGADVKTPCRIMVSCANAQGANPKLAKLEDDIIVK